MKEKEKKEKEKYLTNYGLDELFTDVGSRKSREHSQF